MASRCFLQVMGCKGPDSSASVVVQCDETRVLVNAGEGLQRTALERKARITKVSTVLLSRLSNETLGGLPGVMLTLADANRQALDIVGPEGTSQFFHATRHFMRRPDFAVTTRDGDVAAGGSGSGNDDDDGGGDDDGDGGGDAAPPPSEVLRMAGMDVRCIPLRAAAEDPPAKRRKLDGAAAAAAAAAAAEPQRTCCYVFETHEVRGKLLVDRAVALGVPRGPLLGKLKRGEPVTLPDGTTVRPEACVEPSLPRARLAIFDATASTLPALLAIDAAGVGGAVECAVHLCGAELCASDAYVAWLARLGCDCEHYFLCFREGAEASPFLSAAGNRELLGRVAPDLFPRPAAAGGAEEEERWQRFASACRAGGVRRVRRGSIGDAFHLLPLRARGPAAAEDAAAAVEDKMKARWQEALEHGIAAHMDALRSAGAAAPTARPTTGSAPTSAPNPTTTPTPTLPPTLSPVPTPDPNATAPPSAPGAERRGRLVFLGTGSAIPSKYRNVSGMYLSLEDGGPSLLLDAGEGTLGTLRRVLGTEAAAAAVRELDAVWLSHPHADHHLGLLAFLEARIACAAPRPLLLIAPGAVRSWVEEYASAIGRRDAFDAACSFVDCRELLGAPEGAAQVRMAALWRKGLAELRAVRVKHCNEAYAMVLRDGRGWSIAYSGDCRPSEDFARAARGVRLLVHEATFEAEKVKEALQKKHCTIPEAIAVAKSMGAEHLLLTHFSQRYPRFPHGAAAAEPGGVRIAVAFDGMDVDLRRLGHLGRYLPALQCLFAGDDDADEDADAEGAPADREMPGDFAQACCPPPAGPRA